MLYAMYDTTDNCWLGQNEAGTGPATYTEMPLAVLAAEVARCCLRWGAGRIVIKEFTQHQALKFKDEVKFKIKPLDALKRREMGEIL